jgi:hypothetical protein
MQNIIAIYPLEKSKRIIVRRVGVYSEICLEAGDLFRVISGYECEALLHKHGWDRIPLPEDRQGSTTSGMIGG